MKLPPFGTSALNSDRRPKTTKEAVDLLLESTRMSNMFRLNLDGTVDKVDDTPDQFYQGDKYMRSAMRAGRWVYIPEDLNRVYIDDCEVPQIIKMFDLLEQ